MLSRTCYGVYQTKGRRKINEMKKSELVRQTWENWRIPFKNWWSKNYDDDDDD